MHSFVYSHIHTHITHQFNSFIPASYTHYHRPTTQSTRIHSFIHSLIHSLTHSFTHSLIHSFIHTCKLHTLSSTNNTIGALASPLTTDTDTGCTTNRLLSSLVFSIWRTIEWNK